MTADPLIAKECASPETRRALVVVAAGVHARVLTSPRSK